MAARGEYLAAWLAAAVTIGLGFARIALDKPFKTVTLRLPEARLEILDEKSFQAALASKEKNLEKILQKSKLTPKEAIKEAEKILKERP